MTVPASIHVAEALKQLLDVDGLVTGFVTVVEVADPEGGYRLHVRTGEGPVWRHAGMLAEAQAMIAAGGDR